MIQRFDHNRNGHQDSNIKSGKYISTGMMIGLVLGMMIGLAFGAALMHKYGTSTLSVSMLLGMVFGMAIGMLTAILMYMRKKSKARK